MGSENSVRVIPEEREKITLDLSDLFWVLVSRWRFLLLFTLLGALILGIQSRFFEAPVYESTAKLYVVAASGDSVVDLTDLNIGTSLTNDYKELMLSYPVLDRVIGSLDMDMSSQSLAGMITLSNPPNTRVLCITAKSRDPQLSKEIANTLAGVAQEYLPETMGTVRPNVAQVARAASHRSGPNYILQTLLGAFLGFAASALWFSVRHILADAVGSSDDLTQITGMLPLCEIPEITDTFPAEHSFINVRQKAAGGGHQV